MRKNITIGLSPPEYLRLQGAAAVTNMALSTYVKWLLRSGITGGDSSQQMTAVLERLDHIDVALARLSSGARVPPPVHSASAPAVASGAIIEARLRERGIPSSTIRQLNLVLDELGVIRSA